MNERTSRASFRVPGKEYRYYSTKKAPTGCGPVGYEKGGE